MLKINSLLPMDDGIEARQIVQARTKLWLSHCSDYSVVTGSWRMTKAVQLTVVTGPCRMMKAVQKLQNTNVSTMMNVRRSLTTCDLLFIKKCNLDWLDSLPTRSLDWLDWFDWLPTHISRTLYTATLSDVIHNNTVGKRTVALLNIQQYSASVPNRGWKLYSGRGVLPKLRSSRTRAKVTNITNFSVKASCMIRSMVRSTVRSIVRSTAGSMASAIYASARMAGGGVAVPQYPRVSLFS